VEEVRTSAPKSETVVCHSAAFQLPWTQVGGGVDRSGARIMQDNIRDVMNVALESTR